MKKIIIPDDIQGKELFDFLIANKTALIEQKKALPKRMDPVCSLPDFYSLDKGAAMKTAIGSIPPDATSVRAKIVGNAMNWFDSQRDVLFDDSLKKTIADGNGKLHLKDHTYELDAEVGDVKSISLQQVSLLDLGLDKTGTTQCVIYESDVQKSYDPKTFDKYKAGKINQHSISIYYVKIFLAINNEDYKEEFATWNKYIDKIINQDEVKNYFWAVTEAKLIEVSAVLLGANILTPTLEVKSDTVIRPALTTEQQPSDEFNLNEYISTIKIFN